MNCKPGDLAIVIRDARTAKTAGMLVEVLYLAPADQDFRLPDGFRHNPPGPDEWVVKLSHPVPAPMGSSGRTRMTQYGCMGDRYLRPLPGVDDLDDVETDELLPAAVSGEPK